MTVLLARSYPKPMKMCLAKRKKGKVLIYGCGANSSLGDYGPRLWLPMSCQIPPGHAPPITRRSKSKRDNVGMECVAH